MRKCLQNIFGGGADRKSRKRGQFFNRSRGVCCSRRAVWIRKIDTEVFAIISAADPSIGQIPQSHLSLVDLIRFKPEEAPRRALYELALKGVRFGNAVSEIGGKTVKDLKTRITPVDGGFTVTGGKFYATGALFAHIVPVAALDENRKGHLAFIDRGAPGLAIIDDWSSFGQRTTASGTVELDTVFVPADRVVPRAMQESW